jgi:GR25 family glycosyltransferase involved in LPS biosynthesis
MVTPSDPAKFKGFCITTRPADVIAEDLKLYMPGFDWEVVDKFDLRNVRRADALLNIDCLSFLTRYGSLPSNGAIGCALAHKYCYERMLGDRVHAALILEDDVEMHSVHLGIAAAAMEKVPDYDVISLMSREGVVKRKPVARLAKCAIHRSVYYCHDAAAYVVSRQGAKKLLRSQHPQIKAFADWPIHAWQMKFYLIMPTTIRLSGRPTSVQTRPPEALLPSYLPWVIYRFRRLIWKTIAWVRLGIFRDIRVGKT